MIKLWHPSGRSAIVQFIDGEIAVDIWHRADCPVAHFVADIWVPDTPRNRAHMRALCVDFVAHGVSWPTREDEQGNRVPVLTRGGLPKRGVLARVPRFYEDVVYGTDLMGEYDRERAAVREVTP